MCVCVHVHMYVCVCMCMCARGHYRKNLIIAPPPLLKKKMSLLFCFPSHSCPEIAVQFPVSASEPYFATASYIHCSSNHEALSCHGISPGVSVIITTVIY